MFTKCFRPLPHQNKNWGNTLTYVVYKEKSDIKEKTIITKRLLNREFFPLKINAQLLINIFELDFSLFWTGFLQTTQAVKINVKLDKKSSSSNLFFQTRNLKIQVQINRGNCEMKFKNLLKMIWFGEDRGEGENF